MALPASLCLLAAGAQRAPSRARALESYRRSLQRELGLGLPGANLSLRSAGGGTWRADEDLEPGSLAMVIPPKYVLTVQEALGSGAGKYINCLLYTSPSPRDS